jgi:tRNA (adenine37-N6)-methyltransferase
MEFNAIGYVEAAQEYKYQQPRQGEFARNQGKIILEPNMNFEQALEDLAGFDKIWVIYQFHQNSAWRPKVNPPVCPDGKKKGVFATRSPYRPNPIGLSCVDLISIKGREINIANFDLLDKTPIVDIKPYISHYDSHPSASTGWLPDVAPTENRIHFSALADEQCGWIINKSGPDLFDLVRVQLSIDPLNKKRKRISQLENGNTLLAFRTWRIEFEYSCEDQFIDIISVSSGYTAAELAPNSDDKYSDKDLHREFTMVYQS